LAKRVFHFFVYSNLFIACCALLMAWQTTELLLHAPARNHFYGFLLFSTLCSYSFHWYLTPPDTAPASRTRWHAANRQVHLFLFIAGSIGSAIYLFFLAPYWYWLLGGAFVTFLYSAPKIPHPLFRYLRKIAIGKTIFLAFMWTYGTTILPLLLSEKDWQASFTWFSCSRFFLIYAICILFDYRDREYDKKTGIRSLITFLNDKGITVIFILSLLLFALFSLLLLHHPASMLTVATLLVPSILTALLYNYARRHFGDLLYYFVLDGLMALSALLYWLCNW